MTIPQYVSTPDQVETSFLGRPRPFFTFAADESPDSSFSAGLPALIFVAAGVSFAPAPFLAAVSFLAPAFFAGGAFSESAPSFLAFRFPFPGFSAASGSASTATFFPPAFTGFASVGGCSSTISALGFRPLFAGVLTGSSASAAGSAAVDFRFLAGALAAGFSSSCSGRGDSGSSSASCFRFLGVFFLGVCSLGWGPAGLTSSACQTSNLHVWERSFFFRGGGCYSNRVR
jgi:hypothetical protein